LQMVIISLGQSESGVSDGRRAELRRSVREVLLEPCGGGIEIALMQVHYQVDGAATASRG